MQTKYTYTSTGFPSLSIEGDKIEVKVIGYSNNGYGPEHVEITAHEDGTFVGYSIDAYGGQRREINDTFAAGDVKSYTGTYGVQALYGDFR